MKIIYHHRTQARGAEGVHIREIVRAFEELGHEVYVVSPPGIDIFSDESENTKSINGHVLLRKTWMLISHNLPQMIFELLELGYNYVALKNLGRVTERHKIDLIYERNAFFCWAGIYLAKKYKIPILLEVNEISGIERVRGQVLKSLAKKIEKINFSKADMIIVVSKFLKDHIANMGVASNKIHVIPNGVNLKIFDPNIKYDNNALKNSLRLNNNLILGFVGGFVRWHNFTFLIDVVSNIIKDDRKDISLMLVGDGPLMNELKRIVREKKLDEQIIFTGNIEHKEIPKYIGIMDFCIIPHSNEYRSPIKMFEYMAMGKPVLAPMTEPISNIITNGLDGLLFKQGDKNSLKNCILDLVNDEAKRRKIGEGARNCIVKKYQWNHNAEKIIRIYNEISHKC